MLPTRELGRDADELLLTLALAPVHPGFFLLKVRVGGPGVCVSRAIIRVVKEESILQVYAIYSVPHRKSPMN